MNNTTGGKTTDRNGREPEKVALTSSFQYEYANELLDVLIANYNVRRHKGISNRTPLDYARFLYQHGKDWRYANPDEVQSIVSIRKLRTVRGGASTGRQAYVESDYACYSNEILQNHQALAGKKIWIVYHKEDDCRVAQGFTQEGLSLGILRAAAPWHLSPHSLALRVAIGRASAAGKFTLGSGCDGVRTFLEFVESQPNGKLPVHPAYLEARRILTESQDYSINDVMLQRAQARAESSDSTEQVQYSDDPVYSRSATVKSDSKRKQPEQRLNTVLKAPLPPRRLVATGSKK
jgi:hypothetical protein